MEHRSFSTAITVSQTPQAAYQAILDFRAWWSEQIEGGTAKLGERFFYHYKDNHLCKLRMVEDIPGKKLVYLVTENEFNFIPDKTEWVNSKLVFEILPEGNRTRVVFTHEGLTPQLACYQVCHDAWTNYIQNSLFKLITTGKGEPNPKDKDGFNAELAEKWKL